MTLYTNLVKSHNKAIALIGILLYLLATNTVVDVIQTQPQLLPSIRALERYKQLVIEPIEREVRVIVLVGLPGTGKSRYCWENYPNLFSKPSGNWWDGYNGEETVLLDDFYGDIEYSELLKFLTGINTGFPSKVLLLALVGQQY